MRPRAEWTPDCQGKWDYDGSIVSISTRYWPAGGGFHILDERGFRESNDPRIKPSAHAAIHLDHGKEDWIVLSEASFESDSEAEVKVQVERWVQAEFERIVSLVKP